MRKEQEKTKKTVRALSRKRFPKQLQNGTGDMVDIDMVREDHLRKHDVVERVFARIEKLEAQLAKEHEKMLNELEKYYDYVEAETGFRPYNESGHTISNYSKTKQIMLHRRPVIEFDDGILIAKQIIDECFRKWGAGADKRLFMAISRAFKVDSKGMLRKDLILSLQSYDIDDPDWKKAMKVINDSMSVITKKEWIALRRRTGFAGKWKSVNLNFSSMGQED